jgi:gamma-glutamylcyclotransferase (GGCT)/AIG2-like uncharacterized protein YtfP
LLGWGHSPASVVLGGRSATTLSDFCACEPLVSPMNPELLFVYGTLRRRFARHSLLQRLGGRYVGKGTICGELFDLGDYPGAVQADHTAQHADPYQADAGKALGAEDINPVAPSSHGQPVRTVIGEVFRLSNPERAFRALDAYEGARSVNGLYRRERTEVTLEGAGRVTAWVYWLNCTPSGMRRIVSGDYARRRKL